MVNRREADGLQPTSPPPIPGTNVKSMPLREMRGETGPRVAGQGSHLGGVERSSCTFVPLPACPCSYFPPAVPPGDISVSSADRVRVYPISPSPGLPKAIVCPSPDPVALLLCPQCWVFSTQPCWVTPPGTDPRRLSAASAGQLC